jgi:membrane-associated phospholipid phosphatase
MQTILHWDHSLLRLINYTWQNDLFDFLMPWLRNATAWVPLYFFLGLFILTNFKKTGWWCILFAAGAVILSNYISANLIKENIIRLRPCNNPDLASWLRVLVPYRPQSSSFVSSHAANHFCMGTFLYIALKDQIGNWALLFFLWAFSISYAQMYVGVHYPIDVACGAVIGILIGYLIGNFFNKKFALA